MTMFSNSTGTLLAKDKLLLFPSTKPGQIRKGFWNRMLEVWLRPHESRMSCDGRAMFEL
jgi:hypothetical protein